MTVKGAYKDTGELMKNDIDKVLVVLANYLDNAGLNKYSDAVDYLIKHSSLRQEIVDSIKDKFPYENINKIHGISNAFIKRNKDFFDGPDSIVIFKEILNKTNGLNDLVLVNLSTARKDDVNLYSSIPMGEEDISNLKSLRLGRKELEWFKKAYSLNETHNARDCIAIMSLYTKNREKVRLSIQESTSDDDKSISPSFDDLIRSLEGVDTKRMKLFKIKDKAIRDTFKIYEDSDFSVVQPRSTASSQYWASKTKWCTGYMDDSTNLYLTYTASDEWIFYYILTKSSSDKYNASKLMDKISIVYTKDNQGNIHCLDDSGDNATVNRGNVSIKKSDIELYLGDKSEAVMAAIESDAKSKQFSDVFTDEAIMGMKSDVFFKMSTRFLEDSILKEKIDSIRKDTSQSFDHAAEIYFKGKEYLIYPELKQEMLEDFKNIYYFFKDEMFKIPELKSLIPLALKLLNQKRNSSDLKDSFFFSKYQKEPEFQTEEVKPIIQAWLTWLPYDKIIKHKLYEDFSLIYDKIKNLDDDHYFRSNAHLDDALRNITIERVRKMLREESRTTSTYFKYRLYDVEYLRPFLDEFLKHLDADASTKMFFSKDFSLMLSSKAIADKFIIGISKQINGLEDFTFNDYYRPIAIDFIDLLNNDQKRYLIEMLDPETKSGKLMIAMVNDKHEEIKEEYLDDTYVGYDESLDETLLDSEEEYVEPMQE